MVRRSGQTGVPVIAVDGEVIVGFDRATLERVFASKAGKRPSFGARIADASRIAVKQGAVPVFGAYVGAVSPGSAAERSGLQAGDIVTEINLRPINNADDMERALSGVTPGGRVAIVFMRGPHQLRTEAVL